MYTLTVVEFTGLCVWLSSFAYGNSEQVGGRRVTGSGPGFRCQAARVQVPVLSVTRVWPWTSYFTSPWLSFIIMKWT